MTLSSQHVSIVCKSTKESSGLQRRDELSFLEFGLLTLPLPTKLLLEKSRSTLPTATKSLLEMVLHSEEY